MITTGPRAWCAVLFAVILAVPAVADRVTPVTAVDPPPDPRRIIVGVVDTAPPRSAYTRHKALHDAILGDLERRHPVARSAPLIRTLHEQLGARMRAGQDDTPAAVDADITRRYPDRGNRAALRTAALDLLPYYVLEVTDPQVDLDQLCVALKADPDVTVAVRDRIVRLAGIPNDPLLDRQWSMNNTGQPFPVPGGTETGTPGSDVQLIAALEIFDPQRDVVVAVLDTGVDPAHPDLDGRLWTDADGRHGRDFANDDDDPLDDHGHGTHVAGTIAAATNNGVGLAGVCPTARIMAVKFLSRGGFGALTAAYDGVFYAVLNGADVLSNSWSGAMPDEVGQVVMDYAYGHGAIVVASAGNANRRLEQYPAAFDHVIAVAATDAWDHRAPFSNYGPWVDIAAPGVHVLSLRAAGTDMSGSGGLHIVEDDYLLASGTSMSCPHVSGAAAALLAHYPDAGIDDIIARLINTADDIAPLNPEFAAELGPGRLNVHRALTAPHGPRQHVTSIALEEIDGDGNGIAERGERIGVALELTNVWMETAQVIATLSTIDPYVTIIAPQQITAPLTKGGTALVTFSCDVAGDAPLPREIPFALELVPEGGRAQTIALPIALGWPLVDGWPAELTDPVEPIVPLIADIDNNGTTETIATHNSLAHVMRHDGTPLNEGWPRTIPAGHRFSAVGDLDGDDDLELIIGGFSSTLAYHHDATAVDGWPVNVPGNDILCADMDGDGRDEVVIAHFDSLHVRTADATQLTEAWPISAVGNLDQPVVADVDLDGDLEVFVMLAPGAVGTGRLLGFHHTGDPVTGYPIDFDEGFSSAALVTGDLNADGRPEIILAVGGTTIHVLDHTGQSPNSYWPVTLPDDEVWHLALADLTGDGRLEILGAGDASPDIYALDYRGRILDGWPATVPGRFTFFQQPDTIIHGIGDVDGDTFADVVVGATTGVYLFDRTGQLLDNGARLTLEPVTREAALWMGDIDNDTDIDLLLAMQGRLQAYDLPATAGTQWAGHLGSSARTSAHGSTLEMLDRIAFDLERYGPDATARITVINAVLDDDPQAIDSVAIELTSTTETTAEHLTALETAPNSGVFTAATTLDAGRVAADGQLQITDGDDIHCRYFDGAMWHEDVALVDARGPGISNVQLTTTFDGELFHLDTSWTTDEIARGTVLHGIGHPIDSTPSPFQTTTHSIRIEGVQRGATYDVIIESTDAQGNVTRDDNDRAHYVVTIPDKDTTRVVVTRDGQPFSSGFVRLDVYDPALELVADIPSRMLDDGGRAYFDLAAGQSMRVVATVIDLNIALAADFAFPVVDLPADLQLDLISQTVTILDDGRPLVGIPVTPRLDCWPAGPTFNTNTFGQVELFVPANQELSLRIDADRTYWTNTFDVSSGLFTIDVADLAPNVLIAVVDAGTPVPNQTVHTIGVVDGGVGITSDVIVTGTDGERAVWMCADRPVTLQAGLFPNHIRSVPLAPPAIGAEQTAVTLDLDRPRLIASTPPTGGIDARQPQTTAAAPAWDHIDIDFNRLPGDTTPSAFEVTAYGAEAEPPAIAGTEVIGEHRVRVSFAEPIAPGGWTTLTHAETLSGATLGMLPGDVNGDRLSNVRDVLRLIDTLNGNHVLPDHATDIDRNTEPSPADLIRLIDLLEGRPGSDAWRGKTLPVPFDVYWLDNDTTLRGKRPGGTTLKTLVAIDDLRSTVTALAVGNQSLFWSQADDVNRGRIVKADMRGHNPEVLFDIEQPVALAVDVVGQQVYWTQRNGWIRRGPMTAGPIEDLIIQAPVLYAKALAVDARQGWIYWINDKTIYRAGIDVPAGQDPLDRDDIEVVLADLPGPIGLAVDTRREWLYWTDLGEHSVMRSRPDGADLQTVVGYGLDRPYGVAIDEAQRKIYFTDNGSRRMHRANLDGTEVEFVIILDLDDPTGLALTR